MSSGIATKNSMLLALTIDPSIAPEENQDLNSSTSSEKDTTSQNIAVTIVEEISSQLIWQKLHRTTQTNAHMRQSIALASTSSTYANPKPQQQAARTLQFHKISSSSIKTQTVAQLTTEEPR